jgi:mono/diheme cytochrome c family protein
MRRWVWFLIVVVVAGIGVAAYMLKPVSGPERDLTLVADAERGAYLIRLGGCVACHTDRKAERALLSGGAGLTTAFGTFYPPNITPDPEAGIGGWTLAQFSDAMSNGMGPQGHLYPSFPYDSYTYLTDQDVVDLYAGLMAVEPVADPAPGHAVGFPFNIRLSLAGWKNLFFSPGRLEDDALRSARWNRGQYLAWGPGHCVACHTPRNILGARQDDQAFMGSAGGTPGGRVPAITKASLVEEGYDIPGLVDTLKTGFTPGFDILGEAMGEVIADSTSMWTDEDVEAVAAYLLNED